jgi:ABC-type antimicrobial peptide transport system permease subunit
MLGTALAGIGIFGLLAYTVARRTSEIGLRMALGARPVDVLRLILGECVRLTGAGIILGIVGSLALSRLLSSFLFDTPAHDPATLIAVSLIMTAVAVIAGGVPAWRAAAIDPVRALRQD